MPRASFAAAAVTVAAALALGACTHTIKVPDQPFSAYATEQKIPLRLGLHLSDELRKAQWRREVAGDTWLIPIGDSLARNAPVFARAVFDGVVLVDEERSATALAAKRLEVDAVLTPRVLYINRTSGATSFGDSITSIRLEWTLATAEGAPIWIETVSGEAVASTGWTKPEVPLRLAIEDLLKNSQKAMTTSAAIKRFAATHPARARPSQANN
jgi:hypothetical protein